jgi:hypothetical protein
MTSMRVPSGRVKRIAPDDGVWSVAIVRISVDFPAPLGPSKPYIPRGMESVTWSSARVPLG